MADSVANELVRVTAASGRSRTVALPAGPTAVHFTPDGVWVTSAGAATVTRVDPDSLEVTVQVPVGNGPASIVSAFGSVWVANRLDGNVSARRAVDRSDPRDGSGRGRADLGRGSRWTGLGGERVHERHRLPRSDDRPDRTPRAGPRRSGGRVPGIHAGWGLGVGRRFCDVASRRHAQAGHPRLDRYARSGCRLRPAMGCPFAHERRSPRLPEDGRGGRTRPRSRPRRCVARCLRRRAPVSVLAPRTRDPLLDRRPRDARGLPLRTRARLHAQLTRRQSVQRAPRRPRVL